MKEIPKEEFDEINDRATLTGKRTETFKVPTESLKQSTIEEIQKKNVSI